jgi:hypothetical protein
VGNILEYWACFLEYCATLELSLRSDTCGAFLTDVRFRLPRELESSTPKVYLRYSQLNEKIIFFLVTLILINVFNNATAWRNVKRLHDEVAGMARKY